MKSIAMKFQLKNSVLSNPFDLRSERVLIGAVVLDHDRVRCGALDRFGRCYDILIDEDVIVNHELIT